MIISRLGVTKNPTHRRKEEHVNDQSSSRNLLITNCLVHPSRVVAWEFSFLWEEHFPTLVSHPIRVIHGY